MKTYLLSVCTSLCFAGFALPAMAQSTPNGWTVVDTGIQKGTAKVTIGDVQNLDGKTPSQFVAALENTAPEGSVFVSSGGIKDGKIVVQVKREITIDSVKARSVLMLCKTGKNKNRLVDVFTENSKVLDLIGGAKYAISFCDQ